MSLSFQEDKLITQVNKVFMKISKVFNWFFEPQEFKNLSKGFGWKKATVITVSVIPAVTVVGALLTPFIWKGMMCVFHNKKITKLPPTEEGLTGKIRDFYVSFKEKEREIQEKKLALIENKAESSIKKTIPSRNDKKIEKTKGKETARIVLPGRNNPKPKENPRDALINEARRKYY